MNDRFKFRVWDKPLEKYMDFKEFKFMNVEFTFNPITKEAEIEYDKERYIVEQCTGLKDKNGKLIYEGDIVREISKREPEYEEYITEVKLCAFGYPLYDEKSFDFEVIGNIHENPELMEE